MKTIEVTDEMHDDLMQLATDMTTQDPRGTAMPHLFQIRTRKKVYDWGLNGNHKIWVDDGLEIETFDEFWNYLKNNVFENSWLESDDAKAEKVKLETMWEDGLTSYSTDIEDYIEENCPDLKECSYSWEYEYQNSFLTEKACKKHIELNHYHYNQPVDYLNHAWRNPEMELIAKFLCSLVGKQIHK